MNRRTENLLPNFALVEVHNPSDPEGNYWIVEKFNPSRHLHYCEMTGGTYTKRSGVNLFCFLWEVSHLRDRILN